MHGSSSAEPPHRTWFSWILVGTTLLGALAFALGYEGHRIYNVESHGHGHWSDFLYHTLQLFIFHSPHFEHELNPSLQVARYLAPLSLTLLGAEAIWLFWYRRLKTILLFRAKGHTVICGLGHKGQHLAHDFCRKNAKVVVVENDESNAHLRDIEKAGATVLTGDATQLSRLSQVSAQRASFFVAITGDDGRNVQIALRLWELVQLKPEPHTLRCFVHIVNPELRMMLRGHRMFAGVNSIFQTELFDAYADAARLLFRKHPLDRSIKANSENKKVVQLVVVAFGQMGESVALQAAKIGHFAGGIKLRVTILDIDATTKKDNFLVRYPLLDKICDARFVPVNLNDHHVVAEHILTADTAETLTTCVICMDEDARSLSMALVLAKKSEGRDMPICLRLSTRSGLARLLESENGKFPAKLAERLHPFGMVENTCSRETLLKEELDVLAVAIHEKFINDCKAENRRPEDDPALSPWSVLRDDFKDSNRQQADHIEVKLRAIHCHASRKNEKTPEVTEFSAEEVELLARMEHERWNAERWLDGWINGPDKDIEKKINPNLVEWDKLKENIKEYDRKTVRNIPLLLLKAGAKVYRD